MVVDASALLDVLLNVPSAARLAERILQSGRTIHAPHLIDVEVAQALRRHVMAKQVDAVRASDALENLSAFPLIRYPHDVLLPRIWALRSSLTAYDAAYVALAEVLDVPLVTRDAKLARSHGHAARIELL